MVLANPSPLALFGFAFPTILLSICNTGIFKVNASLLGLAIAHGAISQFVVEILLFFKGSTFGLVAFFSYGSFWLSVAILIMMPEIAPEAYPAPSGPFMGAFFLLWGIFSFFLWFATFRQNRVLFCIFLFLWPTFALLSAAHWTGDAPTLQAGGWLELICGCLVFYIALAELLLDAVGAVLLPVGVDSATRARERAFLRHWADLLRDRNPADNPGPGPAKRDSDVERAPAAADLVTKRANGAPPPPPAAGVPPPGVPSGAALRKAPTANLG